MILVDANLLLYAADTLLFAEDAASLAARFREIEITLDSPVVRDTGWRQSWLRPEQSRGAAFLFGDEGHNVYVAAALADGAELYTGVSTP